VKARDVGWSILDVCFTPDARCVLYSSWSDYSKTGTGHLSCLVATAVIDCSNAHVYVLSLSLVHVCSVDGDNETHTALDLKLVFPHSTL